MSWLVIARDAAIVAAVSAVAALGGNAVRGGRRLPLVAERPYDTLVPCPEVDGRAEALAADRIAPGEAGVALVDARAGADFAAWHAPGALSVPYDYLAPTPPEVVRRVLATRARRVVVYGDGGDPDSGEQLARELAGQGVRHVGFVRGGAPVLRRRLGR